MLFFLLFSALCIQAIQNNIETIIIHMPGLSDKGLNFLNPKMPELQKFDFRRRYNNALNPEETFYECNKVGDCNTTLIYTNNISLKEMDLGGPRCIQFYKSMILRAYFLYPDADIILIGASQGSVGPSGALTELIDENHPVVFKIKKVLVEAALGSIHETLNFHAQKIPILKFLPCISTKIVPLIAEYCSFLMMPGFARYDAFAPQMYHHIQRINTSDKTNHIRFFIFHDQNDEIIPCSCAQKAASLFGKSCEYIETNADVNHHLNKEAIKKHKIKFVHLPSNTYQSAIASFLNDKRSPKPVQQKINLAPADTWFISKTSVQRFFIRRARDFIVLATFFASYKTIKYSMQSIAALFKNNH
jgi:hypothetical protein